MTEAPSPMSSARAAAHSRENPTEPWLAELMARHGTELRRHLTGMVGDDADDLLQEVWLTTYRRPPETGAGSNVRAWLYRVATNAALDRLARDRRRRAALDGARLKLVPEGRGAPDATFESLSAKARARVRERLAGLPHKQRQAVWLRWVTGADYAEIARALACSQESARANVYNGMKRLRGELFDLWKEESSG